MRAHLSNAAYGMLDYGAYPIGMLVAAPLMLRNLGVSQYGVWTVANAAVSTGAILASGFGDANIQHVASRRSAGDCDSLLCAVRSMMGINLVLGVAVAGLGWALSPLAAFYLGAHVPTLQDSCVWSLRISSLLMALRALESVCISTQRAFERYGAAVRISIVFRLMALALGVVVSYASQSVAVIMTTTGLLMASGLVLQLWRLKQLLSARTLMPFFDRDAMRALMNFGLFSWLQAVSGVIFSQVDRLMLGVSLGATAVASYAFCAQMAQPIFGFTAAGLHFLFPYLANRRASSQGVSLERPVQIALACNVLFVGATTAPLLLVGKGLLDRWAGTEIVRGSVQVMAPVIWSTALLALNVTPTYSLLAMGRVRVVTLCNVAGGLGMLCLMMYLTPSLGIQGVAIARVCYALVSLLLYIPLYRQLSIESAKRVIHPLEVPAGEYR